MAASHSITQAILGFGTRTDYRLMRTVNRWRPPKWMRLWMIAATRGGDGWLWYAAGVFVAVFGGRERVLALGGAALATGAGVALFVRLKHLIGRKRPCALEPHCWATLLPPDQFSFPSGHTITAFAVALSLGAFYPAMLPGLLFCAASVAASRILLGMHFLSDVVAGAAIGSALGAISWAIVSRLGDSRRRLKAGGSQDWPPHTVQVNSSQLNTGHSALQGKVGRAILPAAAFQAASAQSSCFPSIPYGYSG